MRLRLRRVVDGSGVEVSRRLFGRMVVRCFSKHSERVAVGHCSGGFERRVVAEIGLGQRGPSCRIERLLKLRATGAGVVRCFSKHFERVAVGHCSGGFERRVVAEIGLGQRGPSCRIERLLKLRATELGVVAALASTSSVLRLGIVV